MSRKDAFEKEGFLFLPSFFSEKEVSDLKEAISTVSDDLPRKSKLNKSGLRFLSNVYRSSEEVLKFLSLEKVTNLLAQITEEDLWLRWDQCVVKEPGGSEFPLHRDNVYSKLPYQHLQFWVALTDMTPDHGALMLVPGSHLESHISHKRIGHHWKAKGTAGKEISLSTKKGDVILFSSKLVHGTGPNTTQDDRWAYVAEFVSTAHNDPNVSAPYWQVTSGGQALCGWKEDLSFDEVLTKEELLQSRKLPFSAFRKAKEERKV